MARKVGKKRVIGKGEGAADPGLAEMIGVLLLLVGGGKKSIAKQEERYPGRCFGKSHAAGECKIAICVNKITINGQYADNIKKN